MKILFAKYETNNKVFMLYQYKNQFEYVHVTIILSIDFDLKECKTRKKKKYLCKN